MGLICPNHIKFLLKKYRRVISHSLKNDVKFKEKLTCNFQYDMKNLVNFQPNTQTSENVFSVGSFCPKYTRFELQNTEELSFTTLNSDAKFE